MIAWRYRNTGAIALTNEYQHGADWLLLPCSKCLDCRKAQAKAWALRCRLELQQHASAVFTTLTYDDEHLPATLTKRHVQLWLKRLRQRLWRSETARPLRFFYCGEYGSQSQRPHYHAILYGLTREDRPLIETTWGLGHVRTEPITKRRIGYCAGYTRKKYELHDLKPDRRVDPDTGEEYIWQPPYTDMSRNPGIGAHARQYTNSWRLFTTMDGHKMPVPRYYHEAWKKQATPQQLQELLDEKIKHQALKDTSIERLEAQAKITASKLKLDAEQRNQH